VQLLRKMLRSSSESRFGNSTLKRRKGLSESRTKEGSRVRQTNTPSRLRTETRGASRSHFLGLLNEGQRACPRSTAAPERRFESATAGA